MKEIKVSNEIYNNLEKKRKELEKTLKKDLTIEDTIFELFRIVNTQDE
jgi:hypothetical protein